ncbi:MAG: glycosyltransferase family 2 protein, partial [Cytophagales bacterium]|nr:glycosyltransferase family 2 protein [Cytophagales bacterium]
MKYLEWAFWICIFISFYAYLGYGILLYLIVKIKRVLTKKEPNFDETFTPSVTFVVPCYNESETVVQKIENCISMDYPKELYSIIFITDGSTDGTPEIVKKYEGQVQLLHSPLRKGKAAAENRSMEFVKSDIVIFSDANTILPVDAVKKLVRHYSNPKVGAVSGEKRILKKASDKAAGAGEGIYWKYESFLKKLDSELLTIVGAAGELFSFRTSLFEPLEEDSILDDFMVSMRIADRGYRVIYEPEAYAQETASESIKEELKRKIRICAGGWQSMSRLLPVLNPFRNFTLTFQYVSHRVLRWSIVPLLLLLAIPLNIILTKLTWFYTLLLGAQTIFYSLALLGWYFENRNIKIKVLFVPYYFFIMNYAVIMGFFR